MATEDQLTTQLASQSGSTTTQIPATTATTPTSITTGNSTLDTYNQNRESQIRNVYDMARQNNLAALQTAYDKNMSTAQEALEKISPQYRESANELSAEYERQRRNNNLQAAANGLNTGAGSQMQLAQSNVYQTNQGKLKRQENEALDTANRSIVDLKTDYQNQIAQAAANNDYQLAAALLEEYGQQYERQLSQAQQLAEYGDFSLYTNIYGAEAAQAMEKSWLLQNPSLAYTLGKITADEYFKMTGSYPPDVAAQMAAAAKASSAYSGVRQGWASGNRYTSYQQALNALGAGLDVDGIYGSKSQAAARIYDPDGSIAASYGISSSMY